MQNQINARKRNLGVIITCDSKNTWYNTFEVMCENYSHDVEVGLQKELLRNNCGMLFERVDAVSQNTRPPMLLRNNMVDGIFIIGGMCSESYLRMIQKYKVPVVLIGREHPREDYVTSDYTDGTYKGIKYLLEQGHRDILFINGPDDSVTSSLKLAGLKKAFSEFSIQLSERRCLKSQFSGDGGYWATKTAFEKSGLHPTAIFACCDTIAAGVLGYLYEKRIYVPDDVSVVVYERGMLTEYMTPRLTSIEVHKTELGKRAARMMLHRLENPELPQQRSVVPVDLIEGASVRALDI